MEILFCTLWPAQPSLNLSAKLFSCVKWKNCKGETAFHCAVKSAHFRTLSVLMDWIGDEVDESISNSVLAEKDNEGNTALHIALEYNQYILAHCLVENYPKACYVLNNKDISPLYMAIENRNLQLVEHMMINIRQLEQAFVVVELLSGRSLVHAAIETGKLAILEEILENRPELVNLFEDGQTPLSYAAYKGHLNIVRYLLNEFPKFAYKRNDDGSFPIHRACSGGYVNVLKALHSTSHLLNKQGQNILHVAAAHGKADVVSHLLKIVELERLINLKDKDGNTPLHLAAKGFHPRVVYILTCESRVKNELRNKDGLTALDVAEIHADLPISFEAKLTWITLKYINSPRTTARSTQLTREKYFCEQLLKKRYMNSHCGSQSPQQNNYPLQTEKLGNPKVDQEPFKKSSDTIMLVSTLVATVTFAAGFTVPGSYNQNNPNIGMAVLINKWAFQAFVICNTAALFTSILSALCLVWVQLKNLKLMLLSYNLAQALLGFALAMMWLAFTMGLFVVLGNLPWLSYVVLGMAFVFIVVALLVFIPLVSSSYIRNSVVRFLFRGPFLLLLLACEKSSVKYD